MLVRVQISLVVWMFQYPPRTAVAVGLGMAQIGEFAFVLLSSASQHGLLAYQVYMLLMGASQQLLSKVAVSHLQIHPKGIWIVCPKSMAA